MTFLLGMLAGAVLIIVLVIVILCFFSGPLLPW
jgi:hypothetical protein